MDRHSEDNIATWLNRHNGRTTTPTNLHSVTGSERGVLVQDVTMRRSRSTTVVAYAKSQRANITTNYLVGRDPATRTSSLLALMPTLDQSDEINRAVSQISITNTTTQPTVSKSSKTFQFFNNIYNVTSRHDFKPDDEVIWKKYSTQDHPCTGKVIVTAERQNAAGAHDYREVAIVQFKKQPIPKAGMTVLGYYPKMLSGVKNSYVVQLNELSTQFTSLHGISIIELKSRIN